MPSLVTKMKDGRLGGIWVVRWVYLPYFLAANQTLVKFVDGKLNEAFRFKPVLAEGDPAAEEEMTDIVVQSILEFHSNRGFTIRGLKKVLTSIVEMDPGKTAELIPVVDNESASVTPIQSQSFEGTISNESAPPSMNSDESPKGQGAKA